MNPGTRPITAGVDGSAEGLQAADWAAREAGRRRLPLRLLHAGSDPSVLGHAAVQLAFAHPALPIVVRRTAAPAVPALIEAAAEAEALVLGSRASTGITGFLTGSVALAVASRAERPVVVVRAGGQPEDERQPALDGTPPHQAPYLPVVLGLDLGLEVGRAPGRGGGPAPDRPADDLIAYAFDAAAIRSAPLHVVHTWTSPPAGGRTPAAPLPGDTAQHVADRRRVLTGILQPWREKYPATPVLEEVVQAHPGPHLVQASARAGLLVIGRRPPTGAGLGRAARSVIQHVACPVAVVPYD